MEEWFLGERLFDTRPRAGSDHSGCVTVAQLGQRETDGGVLLIADGILLSYYDQELNHIEQVPLKLSPMWFLLRENVQLGGDVTVTAFKKAANAVLIGIVQSDEPEAGSVMLELGDRPLELRQWTITDSAGTQVRVGLYNAQFGVPLQNALFATPRKRNNDRR